MAHGLEGVDALALGLPTCRLDPEPLPKSNDDASSKIFAFVDDLFFAAKIQETARKLNVKVEFVKSEADLQETHQEQWGREALADHFRHE